MEQNIEIWKDIPGYEGYYQVSSFGRVRSLTRVVNGRTLSGKILSLHGLKNSYLHITLYKSNQKQTVLVHRLVGMVFVPGYKKGLDINHKDENKQNNHYQNLEFVTHSYNMAYGNRMAKSLETRKPNMKRVVQMNLDGEIVAMYDSVNDAARKNGYYNTPIWQCCKRKPKALTAYGYVWRFANDTDLSIRLAPDRKKPVVQMALDGTEIATYANAQAAAKALGIASAANISRCCYNKGKKSHGYKWKFKNESQ